MAEKRPQGPAPKKKVGSIRALEEFLKSPASGRGKETE